jgi:hypothetical protein
VKFGRRNWELNKAEGSGFWRDAIGTCWYLGFGETEVY